jgi:hypothetical protein
MPLTSTIPRQKHASCGQIFEAVESSPSDPGNTDQYQSTFIRPAYQWFGTRLIPSFKELRGISVPSLDARYYTLI